jgi:hypothetical protein
VNNVCFEQSQAVVDELKKAAQKEKQNLISHPRHYNRENAIECIDEMELVFGLEATSHFCLLNCWKYRYRAGLKNDGYEDLEKSDWYMHKYKELKEKVEKNLQGSLAFDAGKITISPFINAVPCNTKTGANI